MNLGRANESVYFEIRAVFECRKAEFIVGAKSLIYPQMSAAQTKLLLRARLWSFVGAPLSLDDFLSRL